ncbi:MAG: hypothetical protein R3300_06445 [Candidatus Promineifilaceae bacterium]|nr:hypothetical protein [Candidatus Promineifilaceae bacterium]
MTEESTPEVDEIKSRLSEEIPVEEDEPTGSTKSDPELSAEFRHLGEQFSETLRTAWHSQERHRAEQEVREGLQTAARELNKAFGQLRETPAAQRAREEATDVKNRIESGEASHRARSGMAEGLRWLSGELAKLAEQFTPPEKAPDATPDAEPAIEVTPSEDPAETDA